MNTFFLRLPLVVFLYPTIYLIFLHSPNAFLLGRYSLFQVLIFATSIVGIVLSWLGEIKAQWILTAVSFVIFYGLSIISITNLAIGTIPLIGYVFALERVSILMGIIALIVKNMRQGKELAVNMLVSLFIPLAVIPLLDLSLNSYMLFLNLRGKNLEQKTGSLDNFNQTSTADTSKANALVSSNEPPINIQNKFHPPSQAQAVPKDVSKNSFRGANLNYSFNPDYTSRFPLNKGDWIIIGDSYVWGLGVSPEQTFTNQLDPLVFKSKGQHVHALGWPGGGLDEYLGLIKLLEPQKELGQIIISFYLNDMPYDTQRSPLEYLLTFGLENASYGIRFIRDKLLQAGVVKSNFSYYEQMVFNFDPRAFSYESRMGHVKSRLNEIYQLAKASSLNQPVLLIFPILENFSNYKLANAHSEISKIGNSIGFKVIDFYPIFRETFSDGTKITALPGDIHFNAEAHKYVSETIFNQLLNH